MMIKGDNDIEKKKKKRKISVKRLKSDISHSSWDIVYDFVKLIKETYLLLNSKNTKIKKNQPHPNICVQCDEKTQCGCKIENWCKNKHSF